jgi:hypothetical protein
VGRSYVALLIIGVENFEVVAAMFARKVSTANAGFVYFPVSPGNPY